MIQSIPSRTTLKVWLGEFTKKMPPPLSTMALLKLRMIHAAEELNDLRSPPGNHLEKLSGDLEGYHSIRINR